jgi:hypothetical protein
MSEPSPPKKDNSKASEEEPNRAVSTGGMRRVFRSRHTKARSKSRARIEDDYSNDESSESDSHDDHRVVARAKSAVAPNLSNHYTLNMPSAPAERSELPYVLSGFVSALMLKFVQ